MSKPQRLQLNRDHLIQMARSPDFYAAVPSFLYLRDVALETWRILQTKADCQKCYHEWKYMKGVVDAMFIKLREMKANKDPALEDIKAWLGKRKGYPVGRCVLYYRRSKTQGNIAKFEF